MHAAIFCERANHQYQKAFGRRDAGRKLPARSARQVQALLSTAWEAEVDSAVAVVGVVEEVPLDPDAVVVGCARPTYCGKNIGS
jgi:hypothetical protein